jgi:hypothetical protein
MAGQINRARGVDGDAVAIINATAAQVSDELRRRGNIRLELESLLRGYAGTRETPSKPTTIEAKPTTFVVANQAKI